MAIVTSKKSGLDRCGGFCESSAEILHLFALRRSMAKRSMTNRWEFNLAAWAHPLMLALIFAAALVVAGALTGCSSPPKKQPATIKEFLAQPRPQ